MSWAVLATTEATFRSVSPRAWNNDWAKHVTAMSWWLLYRHRHWQYCVCVIAPTSTLLRTIRGARLGCSIILEQYDASWPARRKHAGRYQCSACNVVGQRGSGASCSTTVFLRAVGLAVLRELEILHYDNVVCIHSISVIVSFHTAIPV